MKITNVSCDQFAGISRRDIALTDGINVIYGKNESGKSTLVNLISRTLFQDAKLNRRSDKDFYEKFFPAERKGTSVKADCVDGTITFETEKGAYTLTKEWGADPRAKLSTPDGGVRDSAAIKDLLREALVYGEGVYSDMLFSSQHNTALALQTILDASKKTDAKQEIADAVSQAFAESDGVSTDAIEQAIRAKIEGIEGKHWDAEREAPERRKTSERWNKEPGEILKAYYALEDAKNTLVKISRLESDADRASRNYSEKDEALRDSEKEYNKFNKFAKELILQSERKKSIERDEADLSKYNNILSRWPGITENVKKAKILKTEMKSRENIDLYDSAKKLHDESTESEKKIAGMPCPEEEEISAIKDAQKRVDRLENKLCGMNLTAAIKMFGGNQVEIKSLRTGEAIEIAETTNITEAVIITVPGVMEMQLSPADVDVESIEEELDRQRSIISKILEKYGVASLEELESVRRDYLDMKTKIDDITTELSRVLGAASFEDVKAAAMAVTDAPRSKNDINAAIMDLCGGMDISGYITSNEVTVSGYEDEHGSVAELEAKVSDLRAELEKNKESVSAAEDIPAEFAGISDPEAHLEKLKNDCDDKRVERENALNEKTAAATSLERYKEDVSGDPEAEVEKAERIFDEQKALLAHWKHIEEVFAERKKNITDNPLMDLAANFTHYLDVISGGKVESEFPEADKLNVNIYSSDRLIDYNKLSEGTRETVSLAFRLAVLDHLFPEGGGIAVLDDPFANMDVERTAQSVELLKDFAARHQVIFLTCKEEYLEILSGNKIMLQEEGYDKR